PKFGIEMSEEPARGGFPSPPQVEAHLAQRLKRRRQDGSYVVRLKNRHANFCSRGWCPRSLTNLKVAKKNEDSIANALPRGVARKQFLAPLAREKVLPRIEPGH